MKLKIIFLINLLLLSGCSGQIPGFLWHPEIWATDSRSQSIVRIDGNNLYIIKTSDPKFDDMICTHKDEPRKAVMAAHEIIKKCKVWEK